MYMSIPISQLIPPPPSPLVNHKFIFYICDSVFMFCNKFTVQKNGTLIIRKAHQNCEIMIHQPLGSTNGQVTDLEIMTTRFTYLKKRLNDILSKNTKQPLSKIIKDTDRNYFMSSQEAKDYNLIDEVIKHQDS